EVAKETFPELRRLLQAFGTDGVSSVLGPNVWAQHVADQIAEVHQDVVITDFRFPHEADLIKGEFGVGDERVVTVRITRAGLVSTDQHESETALDGYDFDWYVDNDSTPEALQDKAGRLAR